ncbi:uncharacterized protein J3R85_020251 [Psidium guajava]|nr:uncharacterized protein J3R85_020251 [Psidium guajava]
MHPPNRSKDQPVNHPLDGSRDRFADHVRWCQEIAKRSDNGIMNDTMNGQMAEVRITRRERAARDARSTPCSVHGRLAHDARAMQLKPASIARLKRAHPERATSLAGDVAASALRS